MARVVDGKIVLGVTDTAVIDTLADVRERNAARKRQEKPQPKTRAPAVSSG